MARKFLYIIAILIVLLIVGAILLMNFAREATEIAFVPRGEFIEQEALPANAYQDPGMWYSRPGIGTTDPARYQPALAAAPAPEVDEEPSPRTPAAERSLEPGALSLTVENSTAATTGEAKDVPEFAVFFVSPTSYAQQGGNWNAAIGDEDTDRGARLLIRGLASPFNKATEIWSPKYRQAAIGAFLTDKPEAAMAIDAAYADVVQAFRYFLDSVDPDMPIVLAGHSQGSLHVLRLLMDEVPGTPVAGRIVAAYAPGWPISIERDLPSLPFPACEAEDQTRCILAWSSFANDPDPDFLMRRYSITPGFDGQPRGDGPILCVNPLTGTVGGEAPEADNLGTLVPSEDLTRGDLVPRAVPARCDAQGFLIIGNPPRMGEGVLPGNNFHVYDIPLFWANVQADVLRRVRAFAGAGAQAQPAG